VTYYVELPTQCSTFLPPFSQDCLRSLIQLVGLFGLLDPNNLVPDDLFNTLNGLNNLA